MVKRFLHRTPSSHHTSMDIGLLYPIDFIDVPLGQTTFLKYSALFRFQPMLAPAFEKIDAHIVSFFVPYRLLWDKYLDFISGQEKLTLPLTKIHITGNALGSSYQKTLLDYFGFPIDFSAGDRNLNFPYFPFLAYHKIWEEHFRNVDIQPELDLEALRELFERGITASNSDVSQIPDFNKLYGLRRVNWGKDRFTKALLETQADPSIQLPVGSDGPFQLRDSDGRRAGIKAQARTSGGESWSYYPSQISISGTEELRYNSGLSGIDFSDFKLAASLWNFLMNQNKYGRDVEGYFKKYGMRNMDMRLQRSEVIGGFSQTMQISDIIATDGGDLGKQGGHAVGYASKTGFKHFAQEPGCILTLCYLRPKANYTGGIPRFFHKRDMLDFPQKEFMNIGYQPIYKSEIGLSKGNPKLPVSEDEMPIFGYELRYNEYRSTPNLVTGELRPGKVLSHWSNPRDFTSPPNLNSQFLECYPSDQIWASPNTDKAIVSINRKVSKKNFLPHTSDPKIHL